jgi:hypothetical protein
MSTSLKTQASIRYPQMALACLQLLEGNQPKLPDATFNCRAGRGGNMLLRTTTFVAQQVGTFTSIVGRHPPMTSTYLLATSSYSANESLSDFSS